MAKAAPDDSASPEFKICENCCAQNVGTAEACAECGKSRFAPGFVKQLRKINRSVSVRVVAPHPTSESTDDRAQLYKWWPGGRQTFNISSPAHWEAIKAIIDVELAPFLGWRTADEIAAEVKSRNGAKTQLGSEVSSLAQQNPLIISEVLRHLKLDKIADEDLPQLGKSIADIAQLLYNIDQSHRLAIQRLIGKLPSQGTAAIDQLSQLMEELTINQITVIANEVNRRVSFLRMFRERVLDERTYEITGDGSIHRLLEQAMWIVDERYWLMHSNRQLRTVVTTALEGEDERYKLNRPDFVCGTVDKKLIVIEIKRPSHTLTVADLNQLERYVVLCNEYSTSHGGSFEAMLVGSKASDDLKRTMKVRGSAFRVRTYTDLVSDTERRYKRYLDALEEPAA